MNAYRSRRSFCRSSLLGTALIPGLISLVGPVDAVEPFHSSPSTHMSLGLAAYSFREYFKNTSTPGSKDPPEGGPLDMLGFIDFCAAHSCEGAELTSYYFPPHVDSAYLLQVKRHAFLKGIAISGTAVGNTFTHGPGAKHDESMELVKRWIDHAAVLGAPHVRIFAGEPPKGMAHTEAQRNCIAAIEEVGDYAARKGVFLGIENHGGIVADSKSLLEIVRAIKSPWVGINLDTGNFHTDDPYSDLERCAPYAVNVQFKAELKPKNQALQPADIPRTLKILQQAGYRGYVTLEYESAEDPWKAVPRLLELLKQELSGLVKPRIGGAANP